MTSNSLDAVILSSYFGQRPVPDDACKALRAAGLRRGASEFSLRDAAAGTVLLGKARRGFEQKRLDRHGLVLGERPVSRWGSYKPQHLFSIDWSDGHMCAPSGECAYFIVPVPAFRKRVVVLSAPTTEMFGYFDVAIGHFTHDQLVPDAASAVLVKHWERLRELEMDRPQLLLRKGFVSSSTVWEWVESVWSENHE